MEPFVVAHIGDTSLGLGVAIGVGAFAGLLATVLMNLPMQRLPEGSTPPFVAAGALTGEDLSEVSEGLASLVHYAAGTLAGVGFVLFAEGIETLVLRQGGAPGFDLVLAGTGILLVPHLIAAGATFSVLFVFFGYVVLPLFGKEARNRARKVRNDWAISATVYTVALTVVLPVLTIALV
jgi:DNA-binding transcriptional LysR family regulator